MIDLMMDAEQDVVSFLERLTGGPLDDMECSDDVTNDSYFAMAGAAQSGEFAQRANSLR